MSPRNESDEQIGLPAPNPQEWNENDDAAEEDEEIEYLEGSGKRGSKSFKNYLSRKGRFLNRDKNSQRSRSSAIWFQ